MTIENPLLKKFRKEMSAGTMSLVLLALLGRENREMYGYEIAKLLKQGNDGPDSLNGSGMFKQGALYPVLRSLSANELLSSRIEPSVSGPPRRYYAITKAGRESLAEWAAAWTSTKEFVDLILQDEESEND